MTAVIEASADSASESAESLAARINKLQDERANLEQRASLARDELANLRVRLITGDAELGEAALAQAKVSTLDGAIEDADKELGRLRLALAEARQREEAERTAARVEALRRERVELQGQLDEAALELDEACARAAATLHPIVLRFAATSAELREVYEQGGNPRQADIYTRDKGWSWPELRFAEQINGVLTVFSNQEARRVEEERRAARKAGRG